MNRSIRWNNFLTIFEFEELLILQFEVEKALLSALLEEEETPLGSGCFLGRAGLALGRLPVGAQAACGDVALTAGAADEGPLVVVEPFVKLQMDKLRKAERTLFAGERLFSFVESHVGLQVGGGTEPLLTLGAGVRLFSWGLDLKLCCL